MALSNQRRVAFVGTGTSVYARMIPDKTQIGLIADASLAAIANAGLTKDDIDGITLTFSGDPVTFAEHLGVIPRFTLSNENGCGSTGFAIDAAEWALTTGRARYVLMAGGAKESVSLRPSGGNFIGRTESGVVYPNMHLVDLDPVWGANHLPQFALVAQRHMFEYGTTPAHYAGVSVGFRYNASLNPDAVYRTPITIEDVLDSPMIASPFTKLMCAMVNDGASAAVITTAERARDLPNTPVYVLGTGTGFAGYTLSKAATGDPSGQYDMTHTIGKMAADIVFERASVQRSDIDMVQLCEHFASVVTYSLEDYGFCKKGEGGPFVDGGKRIMVGGKLPVSTYGGEMSGTHASSAHAPLVEAIRQLNGDIKDFCANWQRGEHTHQPGACRKVQDGKLCLFASVSGKGTTHSLAILTNE